MICKRFYLPFLLFLLFIMIFSYSLCFAQYTTYNPTSYYQTTPWGYPNYQNNTYTPYQTSSYWPNQGVNYIDLYSQTIPYNAGAGNYIPSLTNPYNPYGVASSNAYPALNPGNLLYNYNPLGYGYTSLLFNPFSTLGLPFNLAGTYYPQNSTTNSASGGTTNTDSNSGTTEGNYTAQATSISPTFFPGITTPFQINPFALSSIPLSGLYLNPFTNYLPNQSYYQNPYVSYPYNYNIGQTGPVNTYQSPYVYPTNPYTGNPINPYNQQTPYTQPLPYYQTNSTTTSNTSSQGNLANVNGSWAGTWFTTLPDGTVNNGDATLSLNQNSIDLYGTISFSLNSYQKLSTNLNGTINGSSLTLTGALINGAEIYTIYVNGNISGTNLSGTYSIKTNSGSVVESGTYSIAHL